TTVGRVSDFEKGSIFFDFATQVTTVMTVGPVTENFEILNGIDVSSAQGAIDWARVRDAAIAFAYIKATEADTFNDSRFAANWTAARGNVARGAYHFFHARANVDATRAQADHFIAAIASDPGELTPMVDVELESLADPEFRPLVDATARRVTSA